MSMDEVVELSGGKNCARIEAHTGHRSSHQTVLATSTHEKRVDRRGGVWQAERDGK